MGLSSPRNIHPPPTGDKLGIHGIINENTADKNLLKQIKQGKNKNKSKKRKKQTLVNTNLQWSSARIGEV